jgi:hypothetical protein
VEAAERARQRVRAWHAAERRAEEAQRAAQPEVRCAALAAQACNADSGRPDRWLRWAPRVIQSLASDAPLPASQSPLVLSEAAASARAHILAQARLHRHPQRRGGGTRVGHNQLHRFFKVRHKPTKHPTSTSASSGAPHFRPALRRLLLACELTHRAASTPVAATVCRHG